MQANKRKITSINNNGIDASYFGSQEIPMTGSPARMLSEQISTVNFRLRTSDNSYTSGWHVAGDSTLLIVLSGCIRIELRDGQSKDFSSGQMFIADDYLNIEIKFNDEIHGHRAEIMGDEEFSAVHLKLEKRAI